MGWTGVYMSCPRTREERIAEAIRQEGYNFREEGRVSRVVDSAIVGTTVYIAVEYECAELHDVYGAVILTSYNQSRGEFLTKGMEETMGPRSYDCPKRILDKLSPTTNEDALGWRKICEEKRMKTNASKRDPLAKMDTGKIKVTGYDGEWSPYIRRGKKVFVNWMTMRYLTPAQVRRFGYEIIRK